MKLLVFLLSVTFLPALVFADIFQCIDPESGETVFKDKGCNDSELLEKTIELKNQSVNSTVKPSYLQPRTPSRNDNNGSGLGKNLLKNASLRIN